MKHAFGRPRLVVLLVVAVALSVPGRSARAEVAEARAAVMLRDRPAAAGRVIDRIASGSKLTMIEMSADGAWARVRTKGGREGWVPVASLHTKGKPGHGGDEDAEPAPRTDDGLAKRRNVRPEAWVNKSKYHDDDNKMTVVTNKAELYGRPQASGTVLGIVRRGEVVQFVRKSADKKWVQIDIGAGELAWVEASAVRMGADMPRAGEEPADEPRRPSARREEPVDEPPPARRQPPAPREEAPPPARRTPPPREEPPPARRAEEPPPPPSRKRVEEPSPEELRRADRARDDEAPPGTRRRDDRSAPPPARRPVEEAPPPARRRVEAAPEDEPPPPPRRRRREAEPEARDARPSRPTKPPHGNNYVDLRIRFGFARTGEEYRTNGTSTTLLTNYQFNTTNLGVGVQLGYSRAIGKLRLNLDGKYLMAAAGAVQYTNAKGVSTRLGILDQNFGVGAGVGGFFDVAGGIDLRLRIGADIGVNQISPSSSPISISQDITLAMAIGIEFAMPEVLYFGGRPFGFRIKGGALAPGTRMQQPNLKTEPSNSTLGGYFGAEVGYGLLTNVQRGQLFLTLSYDLALQFSSYSGTCPAGTTVCRDDTVTSANSSSVAHIGAVGLYYQY